MRNAFSASRKQNSKDAIQRVIDLKQCIARLPLSFLKGHRHQQAPGQYLAKIKIMTKMFLALIDISPFTPFIRPQAK